MYIIYQGCPNVLRKDANYKIGAIWGAKIDKGLKGVWGVGLGHPFSIACAAAIFVIL